MISEELLRLLACPACKNHVRLEQDEIVCIHEACGLHYPIRDGIPVMLAGEAEKRGSAFESLK